MQATLTIAESATMHPDGTVSMLRSGITHVWKKEIPVLLNAALVLRLEASPGESGAHTFEVRLMDEDGKDIAPRINGNMEVPTGGGNSHVVVNFNVSFPKFGNYSFYVNVDRVVYQSWSIKVSQAQDEKKSSN